MKAKIDKIQIEFSQEELRIIMTVWSHIGEDDPYGEASNQLGIDCSTVVMCGRAFEEMGKKLI